MLGAMSEVCEWCRALHWPDERISKSTLTSPRFGTCCAHGQVRLPLLNDPPAVLKQLYTSSDPQARNFRDQIRQYNAALAFTSLGVNIDDSVNRGAGPYVFKINGELCHRSGSLLPTPGMEPVYAQLYIHDPHEALDVRMNRNANLDRNTMSALQQVVLDNHFYVGIYQHAYETIEASGGAVHSVSMNLCLNRASDRRRYNLPTADEVAAVVPGDGTTATAPRDVMLHLRGGGIQRITDGHPSYGPLHYVLLFPHGEDGWSFNLRLHCENGSRTSDRLTQVHYYSFRLHPRQNEFSTILRGGRLLQQYMVDAWASTEQNRLNYIRFNQQQIRASVYRGLEDALSQDDHADLNELGQRVILPSSFQGSPRHMYQQFQDGMAIGRYYQKMDLLITVTANPQWPEIIDALLPGQSPEDRPDLVARIFHMKVKAIMHEIYKGGVLGQAVAYIYTVEFQKRGLPHVHLLVFLARHDKLRNPADVDSVISSVWPDPQTQPLLFETIRRCMIHGPCGDANRNAPCMDNGSCTKHFPKSFQDETVMDDQGYPKYRRPNDGRSFEVRNVQVDNRWIVPYNPYLSAKYNCHINVEAAVSFASLKYITKYIHKGHDRATLELQQQDEIKRYVDARYVSAAEAAWRLFTFELHARLPSVLRLQVHLPGHHLVRFDVEEDPHVVLERARSETTSLTAFFEANCDPGTLGQTARQYTYQEFPQRFRLQKVNSRYTWTVRKQGFQLGRMYFVSPTAGELFYLRTLLSIVKGPRSFVDIRTFRGVLSPTFKEACIVRGLLEDDGEWRQCLEEATTMHTGTRLRNLFATLLLFCTPTHPDALWLQFQNHICDDIPRQLQAMQILHPTDEQIYDYGLFLLEKVLNQSNKSLSDFPPMPVPRNEWAGRAINPLIAEQLNYSCPQERVSAEQCISRLNLEQCEAYSHVLGSVEGGAGRLFFLNGPAGTGKTFVYNTICHKVRSEGWIALCVASSGIAALLLRGGRTSHSMFKIPIDGLTDESTCSIPKQSQLAALIRQVKIIIWDEVPMQHRFGPEAVDRTCRDIRNDERPFGGITVVFGGDFQQILPVVVKGTREQIVASSLHRSPLWSHVEVLTLKQNMHLENSEDAQGFAQWLLDVGHGRINAEDGTVQLPEHMRLADISCLMDSIYAGVTNDPPPPPDFFLHRMILSARNEDVHDINTRLLDQMAGDETVFLSADTVITEAGADQPSNNAPYPVEFLRSLNSSGLPLGELHLKVGCPLILLRNLAPAKGLCNGSRMTLLRASQRVLEVQLIGGDHDGEIAFIPRVALMPPASSTGFAFTLRRRQFPVRLAFAMSINKAQGQSVRFVGLDLRVPVFTHGQLYVALSRATSGRRIKVVLGNNGEGGCRTKNIVFPRFC